MRATEIRHLVENRVSYRDWHFTTIPDEEVDHDRIPVGWIVVSANFVTPNTNVRPYDIDAHGYTVNTMFAIDATDNPNELTVLRRIENGIDRTETHERRELLSLDGAVTFHPHYRNGHDRWWADTAPQDGHVYSYIWSDHNPDAVHGLAVRGWR